MISDEAKDDRVYIVLVNHEEQYSLWLKGQAVPQGWKVVGPEGSKEECSKYVGEVWTDMTPLSLRKKLAG